MWFGADTWLRSFRILFTQLGYWRLTVFWGWQCYVGWQESFDWIFFHMFSLMFHCFLCSVGYGFWCFWLIDFVMLWLIWAAVFQLEVSVFSSHTVWSFEINVFFQVQRVCGRGGVGAACDRERLNWYPTSSQKVSVLHCEGRFTGVGGQGWHSKKIRKIKISVDTNLKHVCLMRPFRMRKGFLSRSRRVSWQLTKIWCVSWSA